MALTLLSTCILPTIARQMADSAGFAIDEHALIATIPVCNSTVRKRIATLAQKEITALFTSPMAVRAAIELLQGKGPSSWSCYGTCNTTHRLLDGFVGTAQIKGVAASALELAALVRRSPPSGRPLVFFCGDQRREELPRMLNASGLSLEELILYRTLPVPVYLTKSYQGILFCSPSAVRAFFSSNEAPRETVFFAIGPSTAHELQQSAPNPVLISKKPDKYCLLRLALDYFGETDCTEAALDAK